MALRFSHPTIEKLRLSDVYVDPQFRKEHLIEDDETIYGLSLIKQSGIGKILLYGDDHAGKTSFLARAFMRGLELGYVPLHVTRKDISTGSITDRDRLLKGIAKAQYGERAAELYFEIPKDKRLILIDDLDRLAANEDAYIRSLEYLNGHADNCIVTVNERFDASVIGSKTVSNLIREFTSCRFLGFSYVQRGSLIERWYALDKSLERVDFDRKVHAAQEHLDAAIGKGLIPSTPFNTLVILQAMETAQRSQVVDAGIAQHYDMLLRRRLIESGAEPKRLDGLYAYLSRLAWWMKEKGVTELDRSELESFTRTFSSAVNPVDYREQIKLLLDARIIQSSDSLYRFKYPSSRYFFLAHYIADSIEDDLSLRKFVINACRHLYVKENANLIVFLTSKVASKWIVREVVNVMHTLLDILNPLDVAKDSQKINKWISSTAKLAVIDSNEDKAGNRAEYRRQQELAENEEAQDSDFNEVEDVKELDVFTQINLVFKTGEILGLILKGRFGSLNAEMKTSIARELFEGPLRAISLFLGTVNQEPDALVEGLTNKWIEKGVNKNKEQLQELARKFIFYAIGSYSLALMTRQGSIIGSPELVHVYDNMQIDLSTQESNKDAGMSLTYRLVNVAGRLSYPGEIPFTEIERLAKIFKSNAFAWNLLQGLVANHLYMFPVKFDSKQRLAKAVEIDLKKQVAKDALKQDEKTTKNFKSRNSQSLIQRLSKSFIAANAPLIDRVLGKKDERPEGE